MNLIIRNFIYLCFFTLGFISPYKLLQNVKIPNYVPHFYAKEKIKSYELFAPWHQKYKKTIIISNCTLSLDHLHYDSASKSILTDPFSQIEHLLNDFNHKNNTDRTHRFYSLSRSNTSFRDFIFLFDHSLTIKNTKNIIISPGSGAFFSVQQSDLASTLEALNILIEWRDKYLKIAPEISSLIKLLKTQPEYQVAISRYGKDWQKKIDISSKTLKRYHPEGAHEYLYLDSNKSRSEVDFIGSIQQFFRLPSMIKTYFLLKHTNAFRADHTYRTRKIETLRESYRESLKDKNHEVPLIINEKQFYSFDKTALSNWVKIISHIGKVENKKIIYYFPPNPSIDTGLYNSYFKQNVLSLFDKHKDNSNIFSIVHTNLNNLSKDLLIPNYDQRINQEFYHGRKTNIAGKEVVAQLLYNELLKLNLISGKIQKDYQKQVSLDTVTLKNKVHPTNFISRYPKEMYNYTKRVSKDETLQLKDYTKLKLHKQIKTRALRYQGLTPHKYTCSGNKKSFCRYVPLDD